MLKLKATLHYAKVTSIILVIHITVYLFSPGSWLAAIVPSVFVLVTLLPEKNDYLKINNNHSGEGVTEALTYRHLSDSLKEDIRKERIIEDGKPVLGNIFSTMARNAAGSYYTEITGPEKRKSSAKIEKNTSFEVDSGYDIVDEESTSNFDHVDPSTEEEIEIIFEIDHDGKEHLVFSDTIENKDPVEINTDSIEAKKSKIRKINRLNNLRNLYWMKIIKGSSVIHYRLLLSLAGHLGKLKNIIYSIHDNIEIETANLRLQLVEELLIEWLLEDRGILNSDLSQIEGKLLPLSEIELLKRNLEDQKLEEFIINTENTIKTIENDEKYYWIKEIHNILYTFTQELLTDTEFLKSITFEIATFLCECLVVISNQNSLVEDKISENKKVVDKIETG